MDFANPDDPDGATPEDDSGIPAGGVGEGLMNGGGGHGTKMLDMITGARGGISKRVQPIVCVEFFRPRGRSIHSLRSSCS